MSEAVRTPLPGRVHALADVPDPVFAAEMVGAGVAIEPVRTDGALVAVAPIAGRILKLHPHAFVILSPAGVGVLVHIGIDTVELKGVGFELLAAEGDQVDVGAPVIRFDPAHIASAGYSVICPVVVMDTKPGSIAITTIGSDVSTGDPLYSVTE